MNEWGWAIAAAVLIITLVQLLTYYYLMRGGSSTDVGPASTDGPRATTGSGLRPTDSPFEEPDSEEDVRRCMQCGAPNENEAIYTFCRNCGAELS